MKEIWKDIIGYEGMYQISNLGRCKSLDRYISLGVKRFYKGKILSQTLSNGYLSVKLSKKGFKPITITIHRLIALYFIPNILNKPFINHIDGVKTNNNISNLEWCTQTENMQHSFKIGLSKTKTLYQYTLDNIFIKKWNSVIEAKKELNLHSIDACARGKRKSAGGYIWSYNYL